MANGQFSVADVPGAFARGQQFKHQAEIRPLEIAQQQQALASQQQQFGRQEQLAPLQFQSAQLGVESQQQQLDQRTDQQKNQSLFNTALRVDSASDAEIIPILQEQIQRVKSIPGGDATSSEGALKLALAGDFEGVRRGAKNLIEVGVRQGDIKAPIAAPVIKLSSLQQKVAAEGLDPNTPEGQARAREITQGSRTDPSLKPSDQALLNKANEGQLSSSIFANRVQAANEILSDLESTRGFDPTSLQTAFFEAIPGGNLALSDNDQRFIQAKRDFITAVLRKESGAAIGKDEFINEDKKFFPQVGDGKAVLKQKAVGRKRAFENLKAQSKGVFDVQFGSKKGELNSAALNRKITEQDITDTLQANPGLTREQLLQQLGVN